MIRRSRAVLGIAALLVSVISAPSLVRPAEAARSTTEGLIAFSLGVQVPDVNRDDYSAPTDVYTVRPDGTGLRLLTHVPHGAAAALPAWSPSGEAIAYQSNVTGDFELWTMDAQGGSQHRLTHDPGYEHVTPRWSPDGRKILFSRCQKPFGFVAKCSIAVVNADGSGLHIVLDGNHFDTKPVFSPDGRTIAFQSDRGGFTSAIWLVDADGTHLRRRTAARTLAYWPDFTTDGKGILYSKNCCLPHSDVFSVPVGGGTATQLTHAPGLLDAAFASPSPGGSAFLFWTNAQHPNGDLVIQRSDGTLKPVLTGLGDVAAADWGSASLGQEPATAAAVEVRPAARPAALVPGRPGEGDGPSTGASAIADPTHPGRIVYWDFHTDQIYAVSGHGGPAAQLTHTDDNHAAIWPAVSPNGRQIAFTLIAFDGSPARNWIMDANGSHAHQLTGDDAGAFDYQPRFTPDGGHIVFSRCLDVCAIWIMRIDGAEKRAITPFRHSPTEEAVDFDPVVSPDGRHVAFTRYDWQGILARVFVADIGGGHEHRVTPAWLEAGAPTYSADGERLAFASNNKRLGSSIWQIRADGTSRRRLTVRPYPNIDFAPVYSPDGTEIGFASDRRYDDFCCVDIFRMRADGSHEQRIPIDGALCVGALSWGPSPTEASAPLAAASEGPAGRDLPCPSGRGSLRLMPCSATPAPGVGGLLAKFPRGG